MQQQLQLCRSQHDNQLRAKKISCDSEQHMKALGVSRGIHVRSTLGYKSEQNQVRNAVVCVA